MLFHLICPRQGTWDFVPHHQWIDDKEQLIETRTKSHRKLQNAYWYLHQKLQSKANVYYGDVYQLPIELGNFDVVMMGMILGHLRDPFQGIYSASRLCEKRIIITNQAHKKSERKRWFRKQKKVAPVAAFIPSADDAVNDAWWGLSTECIERMLGTVGFKVVETHYSEPKCLAPGRVGHEGCTTIVAERFAGKPVGVAAFAEAA